MTKPPPDQDSQNRIVAVTLDEESIGRSGPDIEHERAIAIYDLVEKNLFAPEGAEGGPFTLHIGITGNRLMFDIGPRAPDRFLIERHRDDAVLRIIVGGRIGHDRLRRSPTDRACASRPSALPSVIAAGPSARNWSGPHLRIEVRFMKSSTPRPEENRAERAVGST